MALQRPEERLVTLNARLCSAKSPYAHKEVQLSAVRNAHNGSSDASYSSAIGPEPGNRTMVSMGCFCHNHSRPSCNIARLPKSNCDYRAEKLRRNVHRDIMRRAQLKKLRWKAILE
jgi:hypothetical protein